MTLAQLLPQAKMLLVTTPQPVAQRVAHRAAEMASKFDLEILGVAENMSAFTAPDGTRHAIFGEGGGRQLAVEIGAPLLGTVPLQEELRAQSDAGVPLVAADPDAPASQALMHLARGIVAATPRELPVVQMPAMAAAPGFGGKELPVIQ
jgi:ATP-binding protein involved in chromosome partitioning